MISIPSRPRTDGPDTRLDAYRTTGPSPGRPTLHLLGVGHVGRALLGLLEPSDPLVVAASDTSGTVHDPAGLDLAELARWKVAGRPLAAHALALGGVDAAEGLRRVRADVVVDATSTRFDRPEWARLLDEHVVGRGGVLALAAKDAAAARAHGWLTSAGNGAVGINAALGGAGAWLADDIVELRASCISASLAGNGSTTVILQVMEGGGSLEDGIAEAGRRGLLETDPELDFRGADAAVKLAVVAQALWGRSIHPDDVPCEDIRRVDPAVVRARAAAGRTTRLVAHARRDGDVFVGYEELAPGNPLSVPSDRAAYAYGIEGGEVRLHVGAGMGPEETARAVLADVRRLTGTTGRKIARRSTRIETSSGTGVVHLPASFRLESGAPLHPAHVTFDVEGDEGAPVVVLVGRNAARTIDTTRFRLVSVDCLGGRGASSGPAASTHWPRGASAGPLDQARAVLAVLDALGVERAHGVIDRSPGGGVALRLAAEAPQRVGRVSDGWERSGAAPADRLP
jgi:homoserine dehydrogenase